MAAVGRPPHGAVGTAADLAVRFRAWDDGYGAEHKSSSATVPAPGPHSTWHHTYGTSWTPTRLRFTHDGTVVRTITDPKLVSRVREFPLLSHECLQFADDSLANAPLHSDSTVYVDHVRVRRQAPPPPPRHPMRPRTPVPRHRRHRASHVGRSRWPTRSPAVAARC
ncbi:family 16 glycosylhydrolase [Streptomyces sp. NPDC019507]|uniref:family 16 glycosylhydrolase n=1 Tax=Streptomyces sp. NPDC019507 TaxID=3154689 RepID=UPI00340164A7